MFWSVWKSGALNSSQSYLPHSFSSLPSPQSLELSHTKSFDLQKPLLQVNWSLPHSKTKEIWTHVHINNMNKRINLEQQSMYGLHQIVITELQSKS